MQIHLYNTQCLPKHNDRKPNLNPAVNQMVLMPSSCDTITGCGAASTLVNTAPLLKTTVLSVGADSVDLQDGFSFHCRLLQERKQDLVLQTVDHVDDYVSHPVNAYHLVKRWNAVTTKVMDTSSLTSTLFHMCSRSLSLLSLSLSLSLSHTHRATLKIIGISIKTFLDRMLTP